MVVEVILVDHDGGDGGWIMIGVIVYVIYVE